MAGVPSFNSVFLSHAADKRSEAAAPLDRSTFALTSCSENESGVSMALFFVSALCNMKQPLLHLPRGGSVRRTFATPRCTGVQSRVWGFLHENLDVSYAIPG